MRFACVLLVVVGGCTALAAEPSERPDEPPAAVRVWTDALGFVTGFRMGGADYALDPRLTLGVVLTHAEVSLEGVSAEGIGWGLSADYFVTGRAISSGLVLGGSLLFLPTEFTDSSQAPVLTGEIFGLGATLSLGYQWVLGPVSIQPALTLAYFNFPDTVYLTGGITPQARSIDKIHGTVPAAHLQVGIAF